MSLHSQIVHTAQNLLITKGELTLSELKEELLRKGIELDPKSSIVRSTIYEMQKKNPHIQRVDRGVYRLIHEDTLSSHSTPNNDTPTPNTTPESPDEILSYLEETESKLLSILQEITDVNWLTSSDDQLYLFRQRWARIKSLSSTLCAYIDHNMK